MPPTTKAAPTDAGLGALGNRLLATLDRQHRRVVTLPTDWTLIEQAIDGDHQTAADLVTRLKANGWLRSVRRGTYVVVDRSATTPTGALELVDHVSKPPYLVTAGRALAGASLSDQAFKRIVVLSPYEQRPWTWRRERVTYALVPEERIWGGKELQVGDGTVRIAKPERAILDSLAQPRWGVSLSQVVQALDRALARDSRFAPRLAHAASRYGRTSLARRLGFLVETLAGAETAAPLLPLVGSDPKPTPLRSGGPSDGEVDPQWRVRVNVPVELLLDHRHGG